MFGNTVRAGAYTDAAPLGPGSSASGLESFARALRSLVKKEESDGSCLVYNFGVGTNDPFLFKFVLAHPDCEVFAFDPFYHESQIQVFPKGAKLKFYSWDCGMGRDPKKWTVSAKRA